MSHVSHMKMWFCNCQRRVLQQLWWKDFLWRHVGVMSHIRMRHVSHVTWWRWPFICETWFIHVTHTNSHMRRHDVFSKITHAKTWCIQQIHKCKDTIYSCHTCESSANAKTLHIYFIHVTQYIYIYIYIYTYINTYIYIHIYTRVFWKGSPHTTEAIHAQMNASCHSYGWITSPIWMSHDTHMNQSSGQWMSHAKQIDASCHTYGWVTS